MFPCLPLVGVGMVGVLGMVEPAKSRAIMTTPVLADNARRGPQPTMCEHQMPRSNQVQEMSGLGAHVSQDCVLSIRRILSFRSIFLPIEMIFYTACVHVYFF